ncbi:hypothetical protein CHS0354_042502 [Potamilus streckersoni]|uniref:CUE domain-containing protein n=1 Tax=Potamilus streckersoni TaxID=2493646 RepID=A0AAE0S9G5_9BIVA|nr:hypothetical protein CHS0354_042502 [Potamilus streckersoni]
MSEYLPLDKRKITIEAKPGGKQETFPALHPRWIEKIQFVSYLATPADSGDRGQVEEWSERLKFIEDDLHWLLQQPYDKFWCQVVFDETLHKLLDTYLRYAPRSYDTITTLPEQCRDRHDEIHRMVFMTCLRIATHKESKEHYITPSVFGVILYENFLFDMPKLFDLCVLYAPENGPLLSKMVGNIFTQQPKYNDDMEQTIHTILQVFNSILEKCGIKAESPHSTPQKLEGSDISKSHLVTMTTTDYQDVVFYLSDIGMTLSRFLEVYPNGCEIFHKNGFLHSLSSFYDLALPEVVSSLKKRSLEQSLKKMLRLKIKEAKSSLLKTFREIIIHCCLEPIIEKRDSMEHCVEDFLVTMSSILNDRRFVTDYESAYPFQDDADILTQVSCDVDKTRIQYIQDSVNIAFATYGKRKAPKGATNRGGRTSPDGAPVPQEDIGAIGGASGGSASGATARGGDMGGSFESDLYQSEKYDLEGACAPRVTGVELDSLITSVKDILPDLGEGFIELCLEEYNYDVEKVIHELLEDKILPSLQDIERTLPRIVRTPPPKTVVSERRNVFDYDEFDVFHRDDVSLDKIRKGKKGKSDDVNLDDHGDLSNIKEKISEAYGYVVEEWGDVPGQDLYEDEYDDTYDTNNVGADDADSADELTTRRPFTIPRVLGGPPQTDRDSSKDKFQSEGEDGEEEEEETRTPRDQFVEDPAKIRERAAERAQARANRRNPGKVYEVKGNARGQGQSADVLRNRRWKEQHKGQHRRAQAEKKRRV